ncbi:hormogonium polysaccharide biosynthesis protein HpsA [Chlorogloeopsis sp. ULAP02]|uniref:hormogonium polysaccharide biosynthesis protein HpsA n=1 Tax=Chlorogloeopsis sp. ULAP02 TaxID=3107926 RepID=UPI003134EF18
MSRNRQRAKAFKKLYKFHKNINQKYISGIKKQTIWLLRSFFASWRRGRSANAGFVLPTVAMVSLIVVLLTATILFRSFERSKNASNVRVNTVVLNAAAPALDRARAKLDALLEDPTLPRGTPTDNALYDALKKNKYTLGDETRLKLAYDIDADNTIETSTTLEDDETVKSAWKYAVDTDNNGKKDTFTLYGIYFRSPSRDASTGQFSRKRNPLEARTPPMDDGSTSAACRNAAGFSTLVGNSSWYKLNSGNLGKSFFVYTVNIPITSLGSLSSTDYEVYKGNKGVVALEFQQDRSRIPLPNNAVWFENDLEVIVGSTALLLNGRVHTNSNLLVGVQNNGGDITFRQVSSKTSCFYNQENGQITVGGNVGNGSLSQVNTSTNVNVDLYQGFGNNISTDYINNTNKSTNQSGGSNIGFNDAAYNQRINRMKTDAFGLCTDCQTATTGGALKTAVNASGYPSVVKTNVTTKVNDADDGTTAQNILLDEIEIYLRNRTRRVPFAEVSDPTGAGALTGYTTTITANLEPQQDWREPINSSNQFIGATSVTLSTSQLEATYPVTQKQEGVQTKIGDRVFVGNNLPALWLQNGQYVGSEANQLIVDSSSNAVNWTRPTGSDAKQRWRNTQIQAVTDLGISNRNGFWEEKAATNPINDLDSVGGVRIVTGAGIYVDGSGSTVDTTSGPFYPRNPNSFLPAPSTTDSTIVWSDTMPMSSPGDNRKGDLLMRATAVYHYKVDYGTDQDPIACVSSYYNPSTSTTARNKVNIDGGYGIDTTNGRSNNGVVYAYPGRGTFTANKTLLQRQANLKFPNGGWVNQPLKDALAKISGTTVPSTGLQLVDYSAIDTALCAISILNNETTFATTLTNLPPHSAIKEATFLDGREVRQISVPSTPTNYDLDLEQRQPSEIRVTDIDLGQLATTTIASNEYLLPYSGIIYATRDDALRDASETYTDGDISSTARSELLSPTDFKLDPTRRPNGIRLINGATLARTSTNTYNAKEKGLILVTNLPAYIKGTFNLHRTSTTSTAEIEEFTETEPTTNFYNRSTANTNFACRAGRTGCPATGGDYWRPATIIADSMTLLSGNFREGFRNEGDYDLNNNTGIAVERNFNPGSLTSSILSTLDARRFNRLKNGFWENNFANSTNLAIGSYTLNGVTPIQRRVNVAGEYLMEVCAKLPVSSCEPGDWYVDPSTNLKASAAISQTFNISTHKAGTTAVLAAPEYRNYARRVAFKRNASNELEEHGSNKYVPIGIDSSGVIQEFRYASSDLPRSANNALWFRTSNDASVANLGQVSYATNNRLYYYLPIDADGNGSPDLDGQPLLVPVLQIHDANNSPPNLRTDAATVAAANDFRGIWLQQPSNTTFNATFVLANSPSRATEVSAGLQNFVRFLENWNNVTAKIKGSFIQIKRSAFSTAPLAPILTARQSITATTSDNLSLFDYSLDNYPTQNSNGLLPYYSPPNRNWGFDVGLLSEQPDLFAQRFTAPPTGRPNEYFREVGRDEAWIKTLLCAGQPSTGTSYTDAVPSEYRPSNCPSIPND